MMKWIREPAVAGSFYPSDPETLRTAVKRMIDRATALPGPAPCALIVPHAGYEYSGQVAAEAYAQILPNRDVIRRVVLLGPSHRVAFRGLALPGVELFRGPFGLIPLDAGAFTLLKYPAVKVRNRAHRLEHSLEVQLPFLQLALDSFSLVPLVAGVVDPEDVANVIEHLWDPPGTLLVVSSDLSHYLSYPEATERDGCTTDAIEALDDARIGHSDACGCEAVKGLLVAARRLGLNARTLQVCNSGDTSGSRDRVVGYGAWMFVEARSCKRAA